MNIRLLYLTREPFPTFRVDVATLFGRYLPRFGVYSDIVAVREGDGGECAWEAGRAFTRLARGRGGRIRARLMLALDLFRLVRADHAAVQVRDRIFGALLGLWAARLRGKPFYYWMSFPFPDYWLERGSPDPSGLAGPGRRLLFRLRGRLSSWLLYRLVLPAADHVFVQSDAMRTMLESHGLPAARMTPVPMGATIPERIEDIPPVDDPRLAGRRVVVYLGALERARRSEVMIEAMAAVRKEFPQAFLVFVGDAEDPGERLWFDALVRELGLQDHVLFTGWLPAEQARRYLRTAEIGLSPCARTPSLEVASPTKVIEYMAWGVPVVANDLPDQAYLIGETGGGLCVPLTPEGFAAGILQLLRDPAAARRMGEAGRRAIPGLRSYEVIARSLAEKYRQLAGGVAQ
ncbi:glycosyltransferase family 4 protein [Methylococcus capsulatus]|uniref:glycosyltransferase family 4 protein n=1 Tax=Methylococcus capsulatus TaxID=414 RepID=UPI001C528ED8|nr:glycosyltransferase family 4 protein [Methylococcus capsulatus]QXP93973.1 glycosyltransferase family 4 protein [Methylococcus capsulatus]UQN11294.1 glycosyltransferase family 4 protein [Methylococcus capsulatus]